MNSKRLALPCAFVAMAFLLATISLSSTRTASAAEISMTNNEVVWHQ